MQHHIDIVPSLSPETKYYELCENWTLIYKELVYGVIVLMLLNLRSKRDIWFLGPAIAMTASSYLNAAKSVIQRLCKLVVLYKTSKS